MNRIICLILSLMIAMPARADVTVPAGTPKRFNGEDWNRQTQYKVGSIYFGDTSGNTLRMLAPSLADDTVVLTLPSSTGVLATDADIATHAADTSTHGVAGAIVGTTETQTITNKDIDGGTASNSLRITVPKNTKTNLDGLTRKEATVVYASDEDKLYVDNGSTLSAVGSGSGAGVENFITNGRAEDSTISGISTYDDGASATPVNCTGGSPSAVSAATRNTTSPISELGDYLLSKSAADGQGEGWAFTVTLPANNPAAVAGWQAAFDAMIRTSAAYVTDDIGIYVYDVTNATTPVLITNIAASTQTFPGPWSWSTSGTSASYRVCFHVQTTSALAYTLNADNVYAGIEMGRPAPAKPSLGPIAWTPTGSWSANTTYSGIYYRDGNLLSGSILVSLAGAPTSATLTINPPTDLTIDSTAYSGTTDRYEVGRVEIVDSGTSDTFAGIVTYSKGDTNLVVRYLGQGANTDTTINRRSVINATSPVTFASGDTLKLTLYNIPIAEWANPSYSADAGNCEYAATSGTWDGASSTTVYGANGSVMGGSLGDNRIKTITWTKPQKFIKVLASRDRASWFEIDGYDIGNNGSYVTRAVDSTTGAVESGVSWRDGASALQTRVVFHEHVRQEVDGTNVVEWPSDAYWVVENCPTPAGSITFAKVAQGKAGLVSGAGQLLGTNTNDSATTGYVGEYIENARTTATPTVTSATYFSIDSGNVTFNDGNETGITLTPGDWDVTATAYCDSGSGNTITLADFFIGTAKGNAATGFDGARGEIVNSLTYASGGFASASIPSVRKLLSATTTYYLKAGLTHSGGTSPTCIGRISARRMR